MRRLTVHSEEGHIISLPYFALSTSSFTVLILLNILYSCTLSGNKIKKKKEKSRDSPRGQIMRPCKLCTLSLIMQSINGTYFEIKSFSVFLYGPCVGRQKLQSRLYFKPSRGVLGKVFNQQ